jgi:hypothetical protein
VTEKDRGRFKASYLLTNTHSVTGSIEYEKRKEYLPFVDAFRDITAEFSYSWGGHLNALLRHEFSNQEPEPGERDKWTWGEVTYKLTNEHELTVGYGQLRGGKVCASGVCRYELPFEGLRIKFSSLF